MTKIINIVIGICLILIGGMMLYEDRPATWANLIWITLIVYGAMIIINPIVKRKIYGSEEEKNIKTVSRK